MSRDFTAMEEAGQPRGLTPRPVGPPEPGGRVEAWGSIQVVHHSPGSRGQQTVVRARTCFVNRVENSHIQSFTGSLRLLWPVISRAEELWPSNVTCKPKTFTLWPVKKILPTLL